MTEQTQNGRTQFSPWLAEVVGHVVLEASQCEDTLGELVVLGRGKELDGIDPDWWTSGERLADAVASLDDPHAELISKTFRDVLRARHIVH